MTNFDALELKVASVKGWDITGVDPEKIKEVLQIAAAFAAKTPGAIMASSMDGKRYVNTNFRSSENKKKQIFFPEPNPICIYYKAANEHLEKSEAIKNNLLKADAGSHVPFDYDLFVDYFQETSEGVTQLSKTIEGFINQLIPEKTELEIAGKKGKNALEWLPIGTKLRDLMVALKGIDFHKSNNQDYSNITGMIAVRDDLVHLKTAVKENFTVYQDLYKRLIDFNQVGCSNSVFIFVNTMVPGYFEEKDENNYPSKSVDQP